MYGIERGARKGSGPVTYADIPGGVSAWAKGPLKVTIQLTIAEFHELRVKCNRYAAEFGLIADFKMMRLKENDSDRVIMIECERG